MIIRRFIFVLIIVLNEAKGFPLISLKNPQAPPAEVLKFLQKYGYVEEEDANSEALYAEEGIADIIKDVQKFGDLPETGILDNATLNLMFSPRCGVPDVHKHNRFKRYIFGSPGWNKGTLTYFIANWSPRLGELKVTKNIEAALDTWAKYSNLKFEKSSSPGADIVVAFGSGYHGDSFPFDGPGYVLAHAFFPNEDGGYGGDVHFDADEQWSDVRGDNSEDGMDFLSVALHELGHSLGLSHSTVSNSVMFPYYRPFNQDSQLRLGYDDILALYELYIRRSLTNTNTEQYEEPTTSSTPSTMPMSTETTEEPTTTSTFSETSLAPVGEPIPKTNSSSLPDICEGHFDAVATFREELFIFKEEYVWRLKDWQKIEMGYPVHLRKIFPHLPTNIKSIDAAYERPDGMIVLFTGKKYWIYDGQDLVEGSPRSLVDYDLPSSLDKIDAVQIWARNGKTYFYWGDRFWRYNETLKKMDEGYPKHMERWRGVPQNLNAATTWKGITYFFKNKLYWKFDNDWVITTEQSPFPSPQLWLGCPETVDIITVV